MQANKLSTDLPPENGDKSSDLVVGAPREPGLTHAHPADALSRLPAWANLDDRVRAAALAAQLPSAPLDPRSAAQAAAASITGAESRNTRRSYEAAQNYLLAWHRLRTGKPYQLPWDRTTFATFLFDHYPHVASAADPTVLPPGLPTSIEDLLVQQGIKGKTGPLAPATLAHRITWLAKAHRDAGLVSPTDDPTIRRLMRSVRKLATTAVKALPRKADAILRTHLQQMLATCDDSPVGVRDRALLLFGWASGGRRRSEIADADLALLLTRGPTSFDYLLDRHKTSTPGEVPPEAYKPIRGSAAAGLAAWLALLESQGHSLARGPLFRSIARNGAIGKMGLSDQVVNRIVKSRATAAGLNGTFSAHSLRSGFATQAQLDNIPAPSAMARTGHRSKKVFDSYHRVDPERGDPVDNLFDGS